jgi:hypothetical protein
MTWQAQAARSFLALVSGKVSTPPLVAGTQRPRRRREVGGANHWFLSVFRGEDFHGSNTEYGADWGAANPAVPLSVSFSFGVSFYA